MEKDIKIQPGFSFQASEFYRLRGILFIIIFLVIHGCHGAASIKQPPVILEDKDITPLIGYTIQAGAFSDVNNAVRLTNDLQAKGLDAYYFVHDSGLFKVRFGNFASLNAAEEVAQRLRSNGIIEEYYIVRPEDYPGLKDKKIVKNDLRKGIILSAKSFIGVPYQWGGVSDETGFDCSGLTMAVYRLNGFILPRTSKQQWAAGNPVTLEQISEGDLVFFSTNKRGVISHVGVYIGMGQFIHAPGKGKKIRTESLSTEYYKNRYMGARTYI